MLNRIVVVFQRLRFMNPYPISKVVVFILPLLVTATANSLDRLSASAIEPGFFLFLEKFHGHTCAGSLMGARMGLAAKSSLKAAGGAGKLKARYFDQTCLVDGIQVAAGTTFGNHAIEILDRNECRLLLSAETNARQVEARLTRNAEEKGKMFRDLRSKARELPAGSPMRQRLERSAEDVLYWFRTAPDADVVQVRVVK